MNCFKCRRVCIPIACRDRPVVARHSGAATSCVSTVADWYARYDNVPDYF
ncbi:hypothetical protein [Fibrella forsythiae]|uniref:Ferredoxin n=1 Tax=Fibrella forsythiae TaxID=2817061 RepID=A0ABS3JML5_9BACT|nr:hypothetical protein [Fibrella forsythiae]MBO0951260.1 hypothetical protein [Fibrella forsythiae]